MSYEIYKTNGTKLVIEDNTIDYDTVSNIALIGKLSPNYGADQSSNFVRLSENFANEEFPEKPLLGMLCYNTAKKGLFLCINQNVTEDNIDDCWLKLPNVKFETTQPAISTAQNGDLWFNNESKSLYIFDSSSKKWILIGPDGYLNKLTNNITATTGESGEYIYTYDFDANKEKANTSYLVTAKIVAKEIIPDTSSLYGTKATETAAWIVRMLINSYDYVVGGVSISKREIVGAPNYETIGKTSGAASDWTVQAMIESANQNLQIKLKGMPTSSKDKLKVNWTVNVEMMKVYKD